MLVATACLGRLLGSPVPSVYEAYRYGDLLVRAVCVETDDRIGLWRVEEVRHHSKRGACDVGDVLRVDVSMTTIQPYQFHPEEEWWLFLQWYSFRPEPYRLTLTLRPESRPGPVPALEPLLPFIEMEDPMAQLEEAERIILERRGPLLDSAMALAHEQHQSSDSEIRLRAGDVFLHLMESDDPQVANRGMADWRRDVRGVPGLARWVARNLDHPITHNAVNSLAQMEGPEATAALIELAGNPEAGVRRNAILALGQRAPASAERMQVIRKAVRDPDETVRETAVGRLAWQGNKDAQDVVWRLSMRTVSSQGTKQERSLAAWKLAYHRGTPQFGDAPQLLDLIAAEARSGEAPEVLWPLLKAAEKLMEQFQPRTQAGRFLAPHFDTLNRIARDFSKASDSRPSGAACPLLAIINTPEAWETIRYVAESDSHTSGAPRARQVLAEKPRRPTRAAEAASP
ncbi:MAG: HEAT repeat domain-containing protein [Verrucomicrobiae bacterium]|nr:HEAT repeat domain-containing protein [Verrucomicrobiae bacterium]